MRLLIVTVLSIFSFISCAFKSRPKEPMVYYSYHAGNGYALWSEKFSAKLQNDGSVELVYGYTHDMSAEEYGDTIVVDISALKHIEEIYIEHKIYKYKERYESPFFVTDGDSWGSTSMFGKDSSKKEIISTGGYESWPKDDGLSQINNYIRSFFPKKNNQIEE